MDGGIGSKMFISPRARPDTGITGVHRETGEALHPRGNLLIGALLCRL
jgi:hypothetical protein